MSAAMANSPQHATCFESMSAYPDFYKKGSITRYARPKLHWNRVQSIDRRQTPTAVSFVEEAVIAQVIVRVRNQNGEDDPPPKLMQVFGWTRAILLNGVGNFQTTSGLMVRGPCLPLSPICEVSSPAA